MTVRRIMILLYGAGGVPGRGEIPMIQIATLVQINPKPVRVYLETGNMTNSEGFFV